MKREIKFRAWDKIEHQMLFSGIDYQLRLISHICQDEFADESVIGFSRLDWDRFDLMQFTGLHDKNGKEIYEGDIVKHTHYECHPQNGIISESILVEWLNNGFRPFNYLNDKADIEVIGNIYEHDYLLNK